MQFNYPLIWLVIIIVTLYIYFISDGTALGSSVLMLFLSQKQKKETLDQLIPVWDANQTWLVFSLAALYGGFSKGFAIIMPEFYLAFIMLVLLLLIRGAAIECSFKSQKKHWYLTLSISSLMIMLLQSYVLTHWLSTTMSADYNTAFSSRFLTSALGIFCFINFNFLLGFNYLSTEFNNKFQYLLLTSFTLIILVFTLSFTPLASKIYTIIAADVLFFIASCISIYKKDNYLKYFLMIFSLLMITITIAQVYPNFLPNGINYQNIASSTTSLKWMISLSMIMLPILFVVLWLFRLHFSNYRLSNKKEEL